MTGARDHRSGEPRLAFGVQEVADALGVSHELVKHMTRTGEMPMVKRGLRRRPSRNAFWCGAFPDTSASDRLDRDMSGIRVSAKSVPDTSRREEAGARL
jgi:hypothetical protein